MRILALETATLQGSVALMENETLIAEYSLNIRATHSERLLPAVSTALKDARWTLPDLDGLAISIGPGSFTGLRIGLSSIKGLSFATNLPIVAVPTLEAMAYQHWPGTARICPCLDARKKEIYTAFYSSNETGLVEHISPRAAEPRLFFEQLQAHEQAPVLFLGDGAKVYRHLIDEFFADQALFAPPYASHPRAATVAFLGLRKLHNHQTEDVINLEPVYLRQSEAEIKWQQKQLSQVEK